MPKETEKTITSREVLFDELDVIRQQGYATEHQERTERLACIGAPVTVDDTLHGAISISLTANNRDSSKFEDELVDAVQRTANQLSLEIKYA
jgi:DNA-binding IclR family transcriptional regulator